MSSVHGVLGCSDPYAICLCKEELVNSKQNARSIHFYWAQENSQSKLQ